MDMALWTMFLNLLKQRIVERIAELVELSDVELDIKYLKFIDQMPPSTASCLSSTHASTTTLTNLQRLFTASLYTRVSQTMECSRMVLPQGAETVIVIFDLSNFGLDNMDWGFVRLFVQCFESYYPETLGVCVVHRAPFVFWDLWKLIQPLLDTLVATKFMFTCNNEELHKVIPRERLPITHYDGLDVWKYEYVPATAGGSAVMEDVAKKEELQKERHGLETKFNAATREWIKNVNGKNSSERDEIAQELREQCSRMTPYVRYKNLYQRWGIVHDGQVTWTYNVKAK